MTRLVNIGGALVAVSTALDGATTPAHPHSPQGKPACAAAATASVPTAPSLKPAPHTS
ncbi:hypothetical protein [Roseateles sp. LYH14W]|uniref:Uncharacterized protein n=1 Tax=Pelomonas parva TaxID=3299032 RepID=A0ABW7F127_9BURK